MSDPHGDAEKAYEAALERLAYVVGLWEKAGSPVISVGSQGQEVTSPLWKAMNEAELMADRLRTRLKSRHRGPAPGAVVEAAIGLSPAAKLRIAK